MSKIKQLFTNWRFLLLLFCLVVFTLLLSPDPFNDGVTIRNVAKNTTAWDAGMRAPLPTDKPMFREVITEINGQVIKDIDDYYAVVDGLDVNDTVRVKTRSNYDKESEKRTLLKSVQTYSMKVRPEYIITVLNETEEVVQEQIVTQNVTDNGTTKLVNKTIQIVTEVPKIVKEVVGKEGIGVDVYNAPTTNLRKGLDLQGGTRVLLEPEEEVSDDDIDIIISNLRQRLNVYGLSDIVLRPVRKGLFEKMLIMVEVAGANEDEVRELIGNQGKFEAKVGNTTVFLGGEDITTVCRTADCSSANDYRNPCGQRSDGTYQCGFYFTIGLSQEAAKRHAEATKDLPVVNENGQDYLSEKLLLYLDNELVDELWIGASLKGQETTAIAISGPGAGQTMQEALLDSTKNMKQLQTVLITGSLPVKLNIVKVDSVSPVLGEKFLKNAIIVGVGAILAVALVIFVRYRTWRIALPVMITMVSEVIMILGAAAGIGWNLDLAAIAGIIIAVGTGVDDQIVIIDETRAGNKGTSNWQQRMKRAFFIIFAAFFTTFAAMAVLFVSGAGLLRGFATATMLGIAIGVFVARPAFAAIVEVLMKDEE